MKSFLVNLAKAGISVAILIWLFARIPLDDRIPWREADWRWMAAAWGVFLAGFGCGYVRWFVLVRALELPFTLRDAFRLGILGFLFSFVAFGVVGGDVLKSAAISRRQPGFRTRAVATVVVDRVVGLFGLFVFAAGSVLLSGLTQSPVSELRLLGWATLAIAVVGTLVLSVFLSTGDSTWFTAWVDRLPMVGAICTRMVNALHAYRRRPGMLAVAGGLTMLGHALFVVGLFLVSQGLSGRGPTFGQQFVLAPMAAVAGAVPLPLNGLGGLEAALEFLYTHGSAGVAPGHGLMVALGYRGVLISIAALGGGYYLASGKRVSEGIAEGNAAERTTPAEATPDDAARQAA